MVFENDDVSMDQVFLVVDVNHICRFCLRSDGALTAIFDDEIDSQILAQLSSFAKIDVKPNENLPTKICHRCRYKIETCYEFQIMVLQSHKVLSENVNVNNEELIKSIDKNESDKKDCSNFETKNFTFSNSNDSVAEFPVLLNDIKKDISTNVIQDNVNHKETKKKLKIDADSSLPKSIVKKIHDYPSIYIANKKKYCLLCLEKCKDEKHLHDHVDEHIIGTDLEPYYQFGERNITCKQCDRFFSYRYNFVSHQREHLDLKPFKCTFEGCEVSFHSKAALRHHLPIHADRNFICSVCAVGFKRKSDLKGHEIIHEDDGIQFECPVCKFVCKNRLTKSAHMKKHQRKPMFKCGSCPKEYFSRSELRRHEYIHMPDKRFRCDRCPYAYYSRSALARHVKMHHVTDGVESKNELLKKCPLCWETHAAISSKICVKRIQESLPKELPYRCENCNKDYLEEVCLRKHSEFCFSEMTSQLLGDCAERTMIPNIDDKFTFIHYKDDLMDLNKDKI